FARLVEAATRHGVPVFLCTNAALIDRQKADFIFASSIKRIQISIDSPDPQTLEWVRRGARFDDVLQGVRHLVEARRDSGRRDVVLNFHAALLRQNCAQLPDLVRLAQREGIDQVSCMFGMIHDYMDLDWSVFWCREDHNRAIDEAEAVAGMLGVVFRPWGRFDLSLTAGAPSGTAPTRNPCYQLFHWTYVDPLGIVHPCCISSSHFLGDLKTTGFADVWHGEHYSELRRTYDTDAPSNPQCAKCYIRLGWDRNSYRPYFAAPLWPAVRARLGMPADAS
ncbi:MAG TPA: SPASM domain-containing protein, partial [Magnetospirillum sp.]|nr:SPASM domain-containing protein [Magnetospirillum sp.]